MKRKAIGGGVYVDGDGGFHVRRLIDGRRTWRKLDATVKLEAFKEAANSNLKSRKQKFSELADLYVEANCPNKRLEEREEEFVKVEKSRIVFLKAFFGKYKPAEIRMPDCLAYKKWRIRKIEKGTGERTVDLDLTTLSNILNYGVLVNVIEFNFIRSGRPRFRKENDVQHCRYSAPRSGCELNQIAEHFFSDPRSEVLGWQFLFGAMTGCRTSELLRLRLDAKTEDEAGFISGNYLFLGRRSKKGVHPYSVIWPETADMLRCFLNWHEQRYSKNPHFFPGRTALSRDQAQEIRTLCANGLSTREAASRFAVSQSQICGIIKGTQNGTDVFVPCGKQALAHGLRHAAKSLGLPRRTAHGTRSFYVTKRRSDGALDTQIAAEIGDSTVELIETYGDRPKNWSGGEKLSWLPKAGSPAWRKWEPAKMDLSMSGQKMSPQMSPSPKDFHVFLRTFTGKYFSENVKKYPIKSMFIGVSPVAQPDLESDYGSEG